MLNKNTREQFFRGECYIRTHVNNYLRVNVITQNYNVALTDMTSTVVRFR